MTLAVFAIVALLVSLGSSQQIPLAGCTEPSGVQGVRCPSDTGNAQVRQAYTYRTGACISFVYAGCNGNQNRFDSFAECQRSCINNGGSTSLSCSPTAPCPSGQTCQRIECITVPCPPGVCVGGVGVTCPGANELYTTCGTCEKTCTAPNPICISAWQTGCRCRAGFVRNTTGQCVPPSQCSTGGNNEFTCRTLPTVDSRCTLTPQAQGARTACWSYTVSCP